MDYIIQVRYFEQDEKYGNDLVKFSFDNPVELRDLSEDIECMYKWLKEKSNTVYESMIGCAEQTFNVVSKHFNGTWEYVRTDGCIEFE